VNELIHWDEIKLITNKQNGKDFYNVIKEIEPFPFLIGTLKIESCPSYHDTCQGKERGENIIFKWRMSGVTFVHMGDYGEAGLSMEQADFISGADVLMIPVGGVYTIGCQTAQEIVEAINPSIVIPMHYKTSRCQININDAGDFVSSFENKARAAIIAQAGPAGKLQFLFIPK